jgi:hypothetical protein
VETFVFDFPAGWQVGLPLVVAVLALAAFVQRRHGLPPARIAVLGLLRAAALLVLVLLLARPTWVTQTPPNPANRVVVLLMDRSESMSVEEADTTRYGQALDFLRQNLLPALKSAGLPVQALLFAEEAEPADGAQLNSAQPQGRRTNLGGAIDRGITSAAHPPLAVIALTDGIANEAADNARGLSALAQNRVPFIGVGFGSDTGTRTLSLRHLDVASVVPTNTLFRISAQLEMVSDDGPLHDHRQGRPAVAHRDAHCGNPRPQPRVPGGKAHPAHRSGTVRDTVPFHERP